MDRTVTKTPCILVADDQADLREALRLLLKGEGFAVETAESTAAALAVLAQREVDCALIDLNYARDTTSGEEGLSLLSRIQALDIFLEMKQAELDFLIDKHSRENKPAGPLSPASPPRQTF